MGLNLGSTTFTSRVTCVEAQVPSLRLCRLLWWWQVVRMAAAQRPWTVVRARHPSERVRFKDLGLKILGFRARILGSRIKSQRGKGG